MSDALRRLLPRFVVVPATPFLMGSPERALSGLARAYGGTRESYREEAPQHTLQLPAFALACVPVTNALYAAFVADNGAAPLRWRGSTPPEALRDHPVVDVSWHDATGFCRWLHAQMTDSQFGVTVERLNERRDEVVAAPRLPSEAEWEHAARGSDGRSFPWGEAWRSELANTREGGVGGTSPVGAYPAGSSPYGVLDMAGNVWEWTASLDMGYVYHPSDGREASQTAGRRILRGGCYANPHGFARCACRFRLLPTVRNEFTGFRLAVSLESE